VTARTVSRRLLLAFAALASLAPREAAGQPAEPAAGAEVLRETAARAQQDLEHSLAELTALRESIAAEKLPRTRRLGELESRLVALRAEQEQALRTLDSRALELGTAGTDIDVRRAENDYLSNLLDEYARNFEARLHVTELQRYQAVLERSHAARDGADVGPAESFGAQAALVDASVERLLDLVGGTTFDGRAVAADGTIHDVRFALVGPVALYASADGREAGLAEQRLGSLEPGMLPLEQPELAAQARAVVATGAGRLPLDPTLGAARRVEAEQDTLVEQIRKGGPVMVPILLLAGAALVIVVFKWVQLARVASPPARRVEALLEALKRGDAPAAARQVQRIAGPTGEMLRAGIDHLGEPKELVEEVMYERVLETRLRLQRLLSFIAISASAAPLLGLLGTVTGIIHTFKLITVFGTGDARTLSSGISEALITTEYGLIVAIPALFAHAFLSRRSRRIIDRMEKTAVSFLNRVVAGTGPVPAVEPVRATGAARVGGLGSAAPALAGSGAMLAGPAEAREH